MKSPPRRVPVVSVCLAIAVAVTVAACGRVGTAPSTTPADFGGIAIRLAQVGIVSQDIVSGDPGCTDSTLAPTAVSFTASGVDQPTPVKLHVYIFRNGDVLTRLRPEVDICARSYVSNPDTYESLEIAPYVIAGQGPWSTGFKDALQRGLAQASQSGG